MTTYYAAAFLATVYLGAIVLYDRQAWNNAAAPDFFLPGRSPPPWHQRLLQAIKETASGFLNAALVFAVSMLGAACFRLAQSLLQERGTLAGHWMVYACIGSVYMTTFAVQVALVLQTAVAPDLRHHRSRAVLWWLAAAFSVVNQIVYSVFETEARALFDSAATSSSTRRHIDIGLEIFWLWRCGSFRFVEEALYPTLRAAQAAQGLNAAVWAASAVWKRAAGRKGQGTAASPKAGTPGLVASFWQRTGGGRRRRRMLRVLNAAFSCVLMWVMLGTFHAYRNRVDDLSSDRNTNSQWTFGQVLAVMTFLPVLVDIYTPFSCRSALSGDNGMAWRDETRTDTDVIVGPENGLSRNVSKAFEVVPVPVSKGEYTGRPGGASEVK